MNVDSIEFSSIPAAEIPLLSTKNSAISAAQQAIKTSIVEGPSLSNRVENKAYLEVTKNATQEERLAFEKKVQKVSPEDVRELLGALKTGNWNHPAFQKKDFLTAALAALKQGTLSQEEFATAAIFWEVNQAHLTHQIKTLSLFNPDGSVNQEAKALIKKTLEIPFGSAIGRAIDPAKPHLADQFLKHLTDQQLDQLLERMKKLPPCQQVVWRVPDTLRSPMIHSATVSERIREIGINVFSRLGDQTRLVPTLGLMQAFLDVKFGSQAVKINTVLGISSLEAIRENGLNGQREMGLHSPFISASHRADGYAAAWYDFLYHDFYHAIIVSAILAYYRHLHIELSDIIHKGSKNLNQCEHLFLKQRLQKIRERIIDMEYYQYSEAFRENRSPYPVFVNLFRSLINNLSYDAGDSTARSLIWECSSHFYRQPQFAETVITVRA
jgi:hypothetical protein